MYELNFEPNRSINKFDQTLLGKVFIDQNMFLTFFRNARAQFSKIIVKKSQPVHPTSLSKLRPQSLPPEWAASWKNGSTRCGRAQALSRTTAVPRPTTITLRKSQNRKWTRSILATNANMSTRGILEMRTNFKWPHLIRSVDWILLSVRAPPIWRVRRFRMACWKRAGQSSTSTLAFWVNIIILNEDSLFWNRSSLAACWGAIWIR